MWQKDKIAFIFPHKNSSKLVLLCVSAKSQLDMAVPLYRCVCVHDID